MRGRALNDKQPTFPHPSHMASRTEPKTRDHHPQGGMGISYVNAVHAAKPVEVPRCLTRKQYLDITINSQGD